MQHDLPNRAEPYAPHFTPMPARQPVRSPRQPATPHNSGGGWRHYIKVVAVGLAIGFGGVGLFVTGFATGFEKGRVVGMASAPVPPKPAASPTTVTVAVKSNDAAPDKTDGNVGIAMPPSNDPAILKQQKLAAAGDLKAQYALAARYALGRGVQLNLPLAQQLLNNAAAGGYPEAMFELANANMDGRFGTVDQRAAARWFEAAATTGSAPAALALGKLYEAGIDGAPDMALALGWYQRAAGYGSDEALAAIARLMPKNTPLTETELKTMQVALKAHGFDVGPPTGKLDRRTQDAIKAYQEEVGLMQDGRPSRFLLEQLTGSQQGKTR